MTTKTQSADRSFTIGDVILYPAHGVGTIVSTGSQMVAGIELDCLVISFERDQMTLRVPLDKAHENGLVRLADTVDERLLKQILKTVAAERKTKQAMWSRRAQEFEQKLNSGDIITLCEAVRDLNRDQTDESTGSYSEQQILAAAARRLIDILAFGWETDFNDAKDRLNQHLEERNKRELRT